MCRRLTATKLSFADCDPASCLPHRQGDQKGKLFVGRVTDKKFRSDSTSQPVSQHCEVHGFAAKVGDDAALILINREVRATQRLCFPGVDPARAARLVVGGTDFAMGVVEPIPGPDFRGTLARAKLPVEGCARLLNPPERPELLPVQFEDKRVESAARLRTHSTMRDDGGGLISGGRSGKLIGKDAAGRPAAHRRAGNGSAADF